MAAASRMLQYLEIRRDLESNRKKWLDLKLQVDKLCFPGSRLLLFFSKYGYAGIKRRRDYPYPISWNGTSVLSRAVKMCLGRQRCEVTQTRKILYNFFLAKQQST